MYKSNNTRYTTSEGKNLHFGRRKKNWFVRHKFLLFFVIIASVLIYLYKDVIKVSDVNIYYDNRLISQENIKSEINNKLWIYIDDNYINHLIDKYEPKYKVIAINKEYLDGVLNIYIEKREPEYLVNARNGKFIVDKDGFVIDKFYGSSSDYDSSKLVFINYLRQELNISDVINSGLLNVGLYYGSAGLDNVNIENDSITTQIEDVVIYLPEVNSLEHAKSKVTLLQKILQQYTIKGKKIESINLRFSDPLIKYKM